MNLSDGTPGDPNMSKAAFEDKARSAWTRVPRLIQEYNEGKIFLYKYIETEQVNQYEFNRG